MWTRSKRANPYSVQFQENLIHRPILPEDATLEGFMGFRKEHNPYKRIFYFFALGNAKKILLSNNIPVEDRERFKAFHRYLEVLYKNLFYFSIIPGTLVGGATASVFVNPSFKSTKIVIFFLSWAFSYYAIKNQLSKLDNSVASYYFSKYRHTAVDNLNEIVDKRRQFFRPNTDTYYRQSHQDVMDEKTPSQLHDPSIYYGPHPYDDYLNVNDLIQINNKFINGKSIYDDPEKERILGDTIDIRRRIRDLPTIEEYRAI